MSKAKLSSNLKCQGYIVGIILGMGSANESRCFNVASFLIGWAHTHNDPGVVGEMGDSKLVWCFLHIQPWIILWIKWISNRYQFSCVHANITNSIAQSVVTLSPEYKQSKWGMMSMCENHLFNNQVLDSSCHVGNGIMYVLSWRNVYTLTKG